MSVSLSVRDQVISEKKMIFPILDELSGILPYYIAGVGIDYDQEPIDRGTDFMGYQWIQCVEGEGLLTIDGNRHKVGKNQGMFLRPNERHEYHATQKTWKVDWVIFHGKQIEVFFESCFLLEKSGVYAISRPEIISDRIHQIYEIEKSEDSLKKISTSQRVYALLMDLMKYVSTHTEKSNEMKYERIQPIINYIENHYQDIITIETLAELIDVTPQYLCTLFKRITSSTIIQYTNMTRIRRSKELLFGNHEIPIKHVAQQVGFSDVSYFCAVFKKLEHITPAEYKNLNSSHV